MAVAAHVFDRETAPPLLTQSWDLERYGVNVLELSPGYLRGIRLAANAYNSLIGYKSAKGRTVKWTELYPEAWQFVSGIIALRKEQRKMERA